MTEPTWTADVHTWLVWADWCHDHDQPEQELRARQIARGLERTGGGLYLFYTKEAGPQVSGAHYCLKDDDVTFTGWTALEAYFWAAACSVEYVVPLYPLQRPATFANNPGCLLMPDYWNTLAEAGRKAGA